MLSEDQQTLPTARRLHFQRIFESASVAAFASVASRDKNEPRHRGCLPAFVRNRCNSGRAERSGEVVAAVGGDEFTFWTDSTASAKCKTVAERRVITWRGRAWHLPYHRALIRSCPFRTAVHWSHSWQKNQRNRPCLLLTRRAQEFFSLLFQAPIARNF